MASLTSTPTTTPKTTRDWVESAIKEGHIRSIVYSDLTDKKYLKRGGFGTILTAIWRRRTKVAMKRLEVGANIMVDEIVKEIMMLQRTKGHSNIIQLYGVSENPETKELLIVMQYAENGTLHQLLKTRFSSLNWVLKIKLATNIAGGLEFIHMEGIAHRDLHSKNILIDSDGKALIADFGIAKMVHSTATSSSGTSMTGMIQYRAPERLGKSRAQVDFQKGDIYALGIIMWELSSGRTPWENLEIADVWKNVFDGQRETLIEGTPAEYATLYEKCWAQDPEERPTVSEVMDTLESMAQEPVMSNSPRNSASSASGQGFPTFNSFGSPPSTFEKTLEEVDSGYLSAARQSQGAQLLVFGKEVVLVNLSTGDTSVITKEVENMSMGTGARAACTANGKVYFISNESGLRALMSYDPISRETAVVNNDEWNKTYSLSAYGNSIFACGVRIHKVDLTDNKATRADMRGGVSADATWYSNNDASAVVDDILFFYEVGGLWSVGKQHLWALDMSEVTEHGFGVARKITRRNLNTLILFAWRSHLCSLSSKGVITEIDQETGAETRVLSGEGGDPAACAVWNDSLFVVEQSGRLREVNLATGMGRVIRQLQEVGINPRSMVIVPT